MALLQSFRDAAMSGDYGVLEQNQVDFILDQIKSFLADDDLLRYERENPPQQEEPTERGTMTMERTWSSAPSTPRGGISRRSLQVAGMFVSTSSPRSTDDLIFDEIPVDPNWTMTLHVAGLW